MIECKKCRKPIVTSTDWGDYDDASEWACTCKCYDFGDCPECKKEQLLIIGERFNTCTECETHVYEPIEE